MAEEKINALVIIEMLGRPADYIKQTMERLIKEQLSKERGIEILSKKISEPKKIENQELFSLFAELELNLESMNELILIIFKYMPSHIEIITPENLRMKNEDLNVISNEIIKRLHQYDEIAKALSVERGMLREQVEKLGAKPAELFQEIKKKKEKNKNSEKTGKKKRKKR
mgnify:CR=1 FL=1